MENRKIIIGDTDGEKTLLELLRGRGIYVPANWRPACAWRA